MAEKTRYSDEELVEFRDLILEKIRLAQRDYQQMMDVLTNKEGNGVDDTMPTYKILEEGSMTQTREELTNMQPDSRSSYRDFRRHWCALKTKPMAFAV